MGRLHSYTTSGVATEFLYDGDRLVAEYNNSGTMLRRYVHGPGVDEPIVWYEGSNLSDRRHLLTDRQGSIIAEDGASVVRYQYGPYGEPNAWTGSRFRYTGQIALPEIQLYHYKARVYDPVLGRFLQTDPIGYQVDLDLYEYVHNDPLNRADPEGTRDKPCDDACQGRVAASRAESGAPPPPTQTAPNGAQSSATASGQEAAPYYKDGVAPPSQAVGQMLQCTASCLGTPLRVTETSGNHPVGDPHTDGLAADVTHSDPERVMQCAAGCGAVYQQNEYTHPSPGATAPHIHLQMRPGRGGATGPYQAPTGRATIDEPPFVGTVRPSY